MTDREKWRLVTREQLKKLFTSKSVATIAAMFDVTSGAVHHKIRVLGLTAKELGLRRIPGKNAAFNPAKEELAELYKQQSMREVAVHYGVPESSVFYKLREYGIPSVSRSERLLGKPKSFEHRLALSKAKMGTQAGDKNPRWKGGTTSPNRTARSKKAYFEWKADVLKVADYKCAKCGMEHGSVCECCGHTIYLHAHHIKEFASNEAGRYNTSNGKALCERCHRTEHDQKIR